MRGQHEFAGVLEAQPPPHVFEAAADRQRRRGQHRAFQLVEQASLQDGRHIDRRGLQEDILPLSRAAAPALDPEHGVAVFRLHQEAKLHLQFLRAPGEVEDLFRLRRQVLEFGTQAGKRLLQAP